MMRSGTFTVGDSVFDVKGEYTPAVPPAPYRHDGGLGHAGSCAEFRPVTVQLGDHDFIEAAHKLYVEVLPAAWIDAKVRNLAHHATKLAAEGHLTGEVAANLLVAAVAEERDRWAPLIDAMASEIAKRQKEPDSSEP